MVFVLLTAVVVFVIAAVTVGREARRLDAVAPRAVYQLDQAVVFAADRLPAESQARLTTDELCALLVSHMNWLHSKGLLPPDVIDARQNIETPVVVADETLIGFLLGEAERIGIEMLEDTDLVAVTEAHLAYFDAIGAVGPIADAV